MLDGELLNKKKGQLLRSRETLYLIYDVLHFGSEDVRREPHTTRMERAKELFALGGSIGPRLLELQKYLPVESKPYYALRSGDDRESPSLFEVIDRLEFDKKNIEYKEDGYVFVPNKMAYNDPIDKCDPKLRRWRNHADAAKWKPPEKLTLDVDVVPTEDPTLFDLYLGKHRELKIGQFVSIKPLTDIRIKEFNYEEGEFRLKQDRPDKGEPNSVKTGQAVMKRLEDPIPLEVLRGRSLRLMRKYNNRVKRLLYEGDSGATLLELGSGPGGDFTKSKKYTRVVLVEPLLRRSRRCDRYTLPQVSSHLCS